MKVQQLIEKYLKFFQNKGHVIIPSASLIPVNDPSVLFNTAGMQPLVPFLLGGKHVQGKRLVNVQKCLRTTDLNAVGDNTHHTFFQMLGNWSLGDYFKKEAIEWSFEFLTSKRWLGISKEKIAITVYAGDKHVPRDEESAQLWRKLGISEKRIAYCDVDNFWNAGLTGPCGPSTEMFYWSAKKKPPEEFNPNDSTLATGGHNWVEIWNDVFMTYNKLEDGSVVPLKQKNVDTGMGLERTLAVLNGKQSAYETDLFLPIIKEIEKLSRKSYEKEKRAMRIIADHLRAAVFILGDENSVTPSNVDRGYILRRLIRRAVLFGKLLDINRNFTPILAEIVVKEYSGIYPELTDNKERILTELQKEEEKFNLTLEKGLKEFERIAKQGNIDGKDAFLLFQSYGFPLEMTLELASEKSVFVDEMGFRKEFEKHQQLSRTGAEQKFKGGLADTSPIVIKMHTATHILNEALRKVISPEIHQRGSNITQERLRFDFSFPRKLTLEEIKKVEGEVNRVITAAIPVIRKEMSRAEAEKIGAQKEFGQKYPDKVSVYSVGDYSKEFCGGPHVKNTREIGHFKIIKEESVAAGVRRIKAVVE